MRRLQLAPDAQYWHRLWSVRLAALGAVGTVASVVFPGVLGFINPLERPRTYMCIAFAFFVAIFVSRLIDQKDIPDA
jgi:hypothetical protein